MTAETPTTFEPTDLDLAELRRSVYANGRTVVFTMPTSYRAEQRAAKLTRSPATCPDRSGLRWTWEELHNGTPDWGVYAYPEPLLDRGAEWDHESLIKLRARLDHWGSPVMVRQFSSSGTSRTSTHRDNTTLKERFPDTEVDLDAIVFRARTVGYGDLRTYVQMAYLRGDDD
ncbi:hypothetical protein HOT45_gp63 [Gordonia phage Trine]|uniref:Uncharacterized protein n=1 Tax=Gordonia phage Trine TaxID=2201431 RepID=A0A2Z4Q978_9CAUD|nr:hypothetical protein HOT45_gp63 [Gordonia phage Trine]AWY06564.1 hypothetical protein PBI_TRINE_63 [Gordonia phage Trine]